MSIVGYGSVGSIQYWIGRNSWVWKFKSVLINVFIYIYYSGYSKGLSWGERGYIRILKNAGNQICISSFSLYPSV
jgi:hypothetical protein